MNRSRMTLFGGIVFASLVVITGSGFRVPGLVPSSPGTRKPEPDYSNDRLTQQKSGTAALLQAVSVVNNSVVWVSGHEGTWARTTDGGSTWITGRVPGADTLQFRDVEATSATAAWLMAAGPGPMSRIYHTIDGGATWALQHLNAEPKAFYDCFAFWDKTHGVLLSDQVDGHTVMLETTDGEDWSELTTSRVPAPAGTEGGFAASGTCLITLGDRMGWAATGAGSAARVFITRDRGTQWTAVTTPIAAGPTAGLTTVAFRDEHHGTVLGGDVGKADDTTSNNVAISGDGGRTWKLGHRTPFPGAVFGSAYATGLNPAALVAVGPGGIARSDNDGKSWERLDSLAYWSVGFGKGSIGWAVGPKGRIVRIDLAP